MVNKDWVSSIINKCEPVKAENLPEGQLIDILVKTCYKHKDLSSTGHG